MPTLEPADYHDISKVTTGQLNTDPQLSPDGERVAYVLQTPLGDADYEATVRVFGLEDGSDRRFTVPGNYDTSPRWSPSGDRLAFLSRRGDGERQQLWVMPTDGGEARPVTDTVGDVTDIVWRPDGEAIAFAQSSTAAERAEGRDIALEDPDYERDPPDPRVIGRTSYRVHDGFIDGRRSHVYQVDLDDDTVTRLTDGEYDHLSPEWGDAATLYYTAKRTGDPDDNHVQDLLACDLEAGEQTKIEQFTFPASYPASPGLAATPDGRIAYTYRPSERAAMRQTELRLLDRNTGETRTLTADFDRPFRALADAPRWGPDREYLYFLAPDRGRIPLFRVPADGRPDPEAVLRGSVRHVTGFDVDADRIVLAQSEWDHPGDLFEVSPPSTDEVSRLTSVNEELLADRTLSEPEEVWFEHDGNEIQGWVLTPPDFDPDATYPLVLEIHGGPHYIWTTSGTMWQEFQTLAAEGYVVFWCNPRGSVGYGAEFAQSIYRDWGGPDYRDLMAGVDTVAERPYVDPDNAFVVGGSYGGFMTSWVVGHTDRFRAAVTQRSVNDIAGMYGSSDGYKFLEEEFGTLPWEDHELLWEHSPAAYVDRIDTPTLVMHAEHDYRATINTAELFYRGLRKQGVDTRFVRYPREGHELSRSGEPQHVVDRLERIIQWLNGYSSYHDRDPVPEVGFDVEADSGVPGP